MYFQWFSILPSQVELVLHYRNIWCLVNVENLRSRLFTVHTPDGAPCGLLNHLAMPVEIVTHPVDGSKIPQVGALIGFKVCSSISLHVCLSVHLFDRWTQDDSAGYR